jgi:hypothetical protein
LALLTDNSKEADRLSNQLLLSQARTTGLAAFIANLPKALNPFADYPAYVLMALAELAKLKAAQDALARNQNATPVKTLEEARSETVSSIARVNEIYTDLMFKINSTNKDNSPVVNVQVQIGNQEITDFVTTQQINNSASGIQSKINRLALID